MTDHPPDEFTTLYSFDNLRSNHRDNCIFLKILMVEVFKIDQVILRRAKPAKMTGVDVTNSLAQAHPN